MIRAKTMAKRISDGLYGKLSFDFACQRGHAFSEAHLHGILAEILASNVDPHGNALRAGYPLQSIQRPNPTQAGRRRELDFAVTEGAGRADGRPMLCLEAKWAGSSHASPENILKDLVRLSLAVREHPEAACFFVLAGGKNNVRALLNKPLLTTQNANRALLASGRPQSTFYLQQRPGGRTTSLDARQQDMIASEFKDPPVRIMTTRYDPPHDDPPNWIVHIWRVHP